MSNITVIRYTFLPYFDGYFQDGNWHDKHDRIIKEKYYNGRICIDVCRKRYGILKLKKLAKRNEVEQSDLPF